MSPELALILSAVITAVGGLVGVAIKEFRQMRKTNSEDHGAVMRKLGEVQEDVNRVGERLDDHIDWHLKK